MGETKLELRAGRAPEHMAQPLVAAAEQDNQHGFELGQIIVEVAEQALDGRRPGRLAFEFGEGPAGRLPI